MKYLNLYESFDEPTSNSQGSNIILVNGWDYSTPQARKSLGDGVYIDMEFTNNREDLIDLLKNHANSDSKIFLYGLENSKIPVKDIASLFTSHQYIDLEFMKDNEFEEIANK
jgi:hypothetical protein